MIDQLQTQTSPVPPQLQGIAASPLQAAQQAGSPPPGVKVIDIGAVFNGFNARIAALEAKASTDVSKVESLFTKYWPIAAGLGLAVAEHFVKL